MFFNQEITPTKAQDFFQSDEKVLEFIASVKWAEGYICRKCGHDNYCDGKNAFSRRCTRCKKEESASSHTIFHNVKFPVSKAFYIAYHVCVLGQDISSGNYAEKLQINPMTCWKFRKKITDCVNRKNNINQQHQLKDILLDYSP